ncbi:protocadherin-16-like [Eucyclogobius newberryi]|uniref:protocadherin-16-like n=1 Tax=Eucyclogobius newberryi TaxID=166745 RepID=UPI003B5A3D3C
MAPLHPSLWRRSWVLLVVVEILTLNVPVITGTLELQLDEEQPAGTIVGDISAGLPPGVTASLYFISDHEGTGVGTDLDIDESTGIIKTAKVLDREVRNHYNFIAVTMTGVTVEVTIKVNDINDHAPTFQKKRAAFTIPEQTAIGTRFPIEPALDSDRGQLTTQGYLIKDGNVAQAFTLETRRGSNEVLYLDLVVNGILDREKRSTYTLTMEAFDGGSPKRTDQMILDISIQDINDNAPVFNQSRYHAIISENLQPGSNILQVFATDADEGSNGVVMYEINRRQSDPESYFVVNPQTGVITLNKALDFEMRRVHELVVQAQDNATQPEVTNSFVTIHVRDYNDNQPTMTIIFLSEDGSPRISEGAQPGQYVARISVTDPDYGEYANVNVSLEGGDGKFALTTKDSIIYLMCVDQILDREERDTYELRVMATDAGTPPLRAESSFTIQVVDVNDNPPLFDQAVYRQTIPEIVFPGSFVLQVTARDKDQGPNGDINYSILQDPDGYSSWFSIDSVTGIITTLSQLDYEKNPYPSIAVMATDGGKPPLSSTAVVNIVLQDINDNEPAFDKNFYNVTVKEDAAPGTCILEVTATDADAGSFGSLSYSLSSSSPLFSIHKGTGQICTTAPLDRDQGLASYDLTVTALDGGGLSSVAYVKVDVDDINDNAPNFYPLMYEVSLSTQSTPGTSVVRVTAHDPDSGENGRITYRTVPGGASPYFTLNKDTGVISLSRSVYGKANTITPMVISAQDGGGLLAPVHARVNISVVAGLVAPPVFQQAQYYFTVSEDVLRGTVVGTVQASAKIGTSQEISYTISSGDPAGYFTVDPDSGALRTNRSLDHEAQPSLDLEVQARSGNPPAFGQTRVHVTISDVNDNPPTFLPSSSESLLLPEHTEIGSVVYRVQAEDMDSAANGHVTFELTSAVGIQRTFSLDRGTGEIRLVGILNFESIPRYDLQVVAKDNGVPQLSATFMLLVHVQAENDHGPIFDTLTYRVELKEGTPINTRFLQVRALNRESPSSSFYSPLSYHLRPDGDAAGFGIAAESGWLFVKSAIDREVKDMYLLTVLASAGHGQLKKTATVRISVVDENDNSPKFTQERVFMAVRENLAAGTGFGHVTATDRDSGANGRLSYRLMHPDRHFQINPHTGEVNTRTSLDREQQSSYQLLVLVQDGGSPSRSATGTAFITVLDENDHAPSFTHSQSGKRLVIQVTEGQASGALLGTLQAKDPDEGENGTVFYSLSGPRAERFSLHPSTGELRSSTPLLSSDRSEYSLTATATDRGHPALSSSLPLVLQVSPAPSSSCPLVLQVSPAPSSSCPLVLQVSTAPSSSCPLVLQVSPALSSSCPLVLQVSPPPSSSCPLVLQVSPALISSCPLARQVSPAPSSSCPLVLQVSPAPSSSCPLVLQVSTAPSSSCPLVLQVSPALSSSCPLVLQVSPPPSSSCPLVLQVSPALISSCPLARQILGVNRPLMKTNSYSLTFNSVEETKPGSVIGTVRLPDQDTPPLQGEVTYTLVGGTDPDRTFMLDRLTGDVYLARPLDYERDPRYTLQIEVDDFSQSPPTSTMVQLDIDIEDSNDHAPKFPEDPITIVVSENSKVGSSIYTFQAVDKDGSGPNSELSYSILHQWPNNLLKIDASSGVLYLGRDLDREVTSNLVLVVKATDQATDMTQRRWGSVTVRVYVTDENDNAPVFSSPNAVSVMEDQPVGFVVLYVMARDPDQGDNGRVSYSIQDGNAGGMFSLNPSTGSLSISKALDREEQDLFNLTVAAEDHGTPPRRSAQTLRVHVVDVNDELPWFEENHYEGHVPENQAPGTRVLSVSATDLDLGTNAQVTYGEISEDFFSIDPLTGVISTTKTLDREQQEVYTLTVYAKDGGLPPNFAKTTVKIRVLDENDHAPVFGRLFYSIEVPENMEPQPLFTLRATDLDTGPSGDISYRIIAGDPSGEFQLDRLSGILSTSRPIDRERKSGYTLTVTASDQGTPPLSSTVSVEIIILDINDHSPQFESSSYTADISEDVPIGSLVVDVKAVDLDQGVNSQIMYFLSQGSKSMFIIDQKTGRIITAAPLDREKVASYTFDICAIDSSPANPRNSTTQVTVYIQDVNDNAPYFIQDPLILNISVTSLSNRRVLATMKAEDKDFGANGSVFYRFANPVRGFTINSLTGDIQVTEKLQGLTQSQRTLIVQAMDQGNPAQSSLGVVVVYIREQEYSGIKFSRNARDVSLQENAAQGTVVTQTQAQYPDGSQNGISYSLFSGNRKSSFGINPISGEIWVQKSEGLDFEESPRLRLVVKAETASSSSYMAVNLILQDINDNLPRFQLQNYVAYIREAQGYDFPIIQVSADDLDQGQNGQVTYSLRSSSMSALFKIDPATGSISTAAIMDREIWTQTKLVVTATDRGTPRLAGSATLTVIIVDLNDNSPMIPVPRELRVPEDTMIGSIITRVTGNDVDSGPALSYTLRLDADTDGLFGIHRYGGGVTLTGALDYERRSWYTLTIHASDSRHHSEANLTVLVEDINDNRPVFTQDLYQVTVSEHLPAGSVVATVTATDRDSGDNGRVTYRVTSSSRGAFYIDPNNGTLFVNQKTEFDFENPSILVLVEARDHGTPFLSSIATIQVHVSDINDNAPIFHQSEYRATMSEDNLPGSTILALEAMDGDLSRDNCGFDFAIASGNSGNVFQIESSVRFLEGKGFQTVGSIILVEELDFEAVPKYNLTVVVSDRGIPQRSSSVPILITITDANDNPPAFSRTEYNIILSEGAAAGTEILYLSANDPDSAPNGEVRFSISSGDENELFQVDMWTGALKLQKTLNSVSQFSHMIVVQASDGQGHYAFAPVTIEVKDINDNRPFFPLKQVTTSIKENQPKNALVTILHAIDHDRGVYGQLKYFMVENSKGGENTFLINQTTGEIRTCSTFDFEKVKSFNFVVGAMDVGNYSATVTVQVYITGMDEYDPVFTSPEFLYEVPDGAKKGQVIGRVQAKDEDGGVDGIVLYSMLDTSPYFEVNKSNGEISLKMDSYSRHVSRSKREVRQMTLEVTAHSPLETSRVAVAKVTVDVTHTAFGIPTDMNTVLVSVIAVSLGTIVILILIAVALFFVKLKRQRKYHKGHGRKPGSSTMMHRFEETKIAANEIIYHQALPGYTTESSNNAGPFNRGGSLDPSHSSGRGSAEAEAAEDDEIRMINEYPRVSSISSSMQERISARGPDSGIQQDADQLSDVSCEPSIDASGWFKKKNGSLSGSIVSGSMYRDDGSSYVSVGRGISMSHPKDYTFPADGKPAVDGSLTAIVATDEELRGSYNWDYLLNWCPQFQPLASVFTEIARLKDETAPQHSRRHFLHKAKLTESRIDPPPLITSVAHPGAKTVPPKPPVGRTYPHLGSFRRSPLSDQGSISSVAMSPSFSPSLSPLAARSPAVTPFSVSQGPLASVISATDHHLEHIEEVELRI